MPLPPDIRENVPADLKTKDWDEVSAELRRRAFFMAGVDQAATLQAFRRAAAKMAAGELSAVEARRLLRQYMALIRYQPEEGKEGTLDDLSSIRRMNVTLRTNVEMVHGWAQRQYQLADMAYPAQELYRAEQRRVPRDWSARWRDAAASVGWKGVARGGKMVALLVSPIWQAISRFGNPAPPYDFNSGMWVKPVSFTDAQALGLINEETRLQMDEARRGAMAEQLNKGVESNTELAPDLRTALARELEGVAEFDADGTLRMI